MVETAQACRTISLLATVLSVGAIVFPPATYLGLSYRHAEGSLETAAEFSAREVMQVVVRNPDMWRFEKVRLVELLPARAGSREPEVWRLRDRRGVTIAESPGTAPAPHVRVSSPVYDAGEMVARVEVTRSLRPLLLRTAALALGLLPVGLALFALLRTLPVHALRRSAEALRRSELERRRIEEQFQASQRLESIGRLAGGVAHDFNNLLTVVLSCTEALKEAVASGALPDPEDVEDIAASALRARDLTQHLLAFARKQVIAPVPLQLNELLGRSEGLLRRMLGEDIRLVVTLGPELWLVRGDPAQLEQIVLNLSGNARDAMERGGTLRIETANARIGAAPPGFPDAPPGDYVRLAVRDSGGGLDPEAKAHLFEPFFTTKPKGKGTGLGLSTVYGIVKQSGGFIRVESGPGQGTTFEILLPRTIEAPSPAVRAAPPRTTSGAEAILVVEDDPRVREVTVRALEAAGYRVLVAESGEQALEIADDALRTVRLLLTDVVMPGLHGPAVAAALRSRHPALRVIYMSGYTQGAIVDVIEAGLEFLPKPFTPGALLARVRAVLDQPDPGASALDHAAVVTPPAIGGDVGS